MHITQFLILMTSSCPGLSRRPIRMNLKASPCPSQSITVAIYQLRFFSVKSSLTVHGHGQIQYPVRGLRL